MSSQDDSYFQESFWENDGSQDNSELDFATRVLPTDDELIGRVIADRYEVQGRLGEGGMGVVYLANHIQLNRPVVIKTLRTAYKTDIKATMRFEREAMGLSQLDHPNIVTIHDFGKEQGLTYLVMEYVEGETLQDRLQSHGVMPLSVFAPIAAQILDAVGEAHRMSLIHRDIKPSNIMLCYKQGRNNFIKVLDFGLAKLMDGHEQTLTQADRLVGTSAFMAPECMVNKEEVDQRVDVYALGVLFYIMLSGRRPFDGDTMAMLYAHVHEEAPPLAAFVPPQHDIPQTLINLIHQCLAKDPADRPFDANALRHALNHAVDPEYLISSPDLALRISGEFPQFSAPVVDDDSSNIIYPGESTGEIKAKRLSNNLLNATDTKSAPNLQESYVAASEQKRKLAIVGVLIVLIMAAVVAGSIFSSSNTDSSKSNESTPDVPVAELLDRITSLIAQNKLAQADRLLKSIEKETKKDPAMLERATTLGLRIEQNRALASADRHEDSKNYDKALKLYKSILEQDPSQPKAKKRVKAIEAFATVMVNSSPKADVWLSPEGSEETFRLGRTPLQRLVPPGDYTLIINATGYDKEREELALSSRTLEELNYELVREGKSPKSSSKKTPRTKKKPRTKTKTKTRTKGGSKVESVIPL